MQPGGGCRAAIAALSAAVLPAEWALEWRRHQPQTPIYNTYGPKRSHICTISVCSELIIRIPARSRTASRSSNANISALAPMSMPRVGSSKMKNFASAFSHLPSQPARSGPQDRAGRDGSGM